MVFDMKFDMMQKIKSIYIYIYTKLFSHKI